MITPLIAIDLPVSYSESIAQLSRRVSDYLLRDGHGAWMLTHCGGIGPDRPSWTVDLSQLGTKDATNYLTSKVQADGSNARYAAGGDEIPHLLAAETERCITARGVFADRIESMTSPCPFHIENMLGDEKSQATLAMTGSFIIWIDSVVKWASQRPSADPEALWRTLVANYNPFASDPEKDSNDHPLPGFAAYFDDFMSWIENAITEAAIDVFNLTQTVVEQLDIPPKVLQYWVTTYGALVDQSVARTTSGTFALVPDTTVETDVIAVIQGVSVPLILRRGEVGYYVVGISYVHGLMNGEAFRNGLRIEDILLQ